jgi:hypothetical protein
LLALLLALLQVLGALYEICHVVYGGLGLYCAVAFSQQFQMLALCAGAGAAAEMRIMLQSK